MTTESIILGLTNKPEQVGMFASTESVNNENGLDLDLTLECFLKY